MDEEKRQYDESIKNGQEKLSDAAKDRAKKETIKKIIKIIGVKAVATIIIIVLAGSLLTAVFLAAAVYFDDLDTKIKASKVKETAIGNEPLDTILTMEDGKYKISYDEETGKEAIESILEDADMNFEDFNNEEIECLYKCLRAEWATTYPNLGGNVNNDDTDSEYVQGVITVKRGKAGEKKENIVKLEYKPYEEFSTIKDESALNYFSMKDNNLVIANWSSNEITYTPSQSMPDEIKSQYVNEGEKISITENMIDYKSMIGIHTMPFELLLSLLVNTEDVEFVNDLADLAFKSTIEITIYDNVTEVITTETEHTNEVTTYKKWVDYYIDTVQKQQVIIQKPTLDLDIPGQDLLTSPQLPTQPQELNKQDNNYIEINSKRTNVNDEEIKSTEKKEVDYTLTTKRTTKTNSYVVGLTKVSSWIADIQNEYSYVPQIGSEEDLGLGEPYVYEPQEKEKEDISTNDTDVVLFKNSKQDTSFGKDSDNNTIITTKNCTITGARKQGTLNGSVELTKNTSQTNEYNYEAPIKQVSNEGQKFEDIYDSHSKAQTQLRDVSSWLFELLEENPSEEDSESSSTVDYVSVMKFLLYICTGEDYGVTEEDMQELLDVMDIQSGNNLIGSFYGNSAEEVVWFALKDLGYSEYAIAGVMGNIYGESGFNPSAVEKSSGEGIGLCQWSYGRKGQLIEYSKSKGKDWSDLNTQIEFLITEIEGTGQASGYATAQMQGKHKGYTKNDWKSAQDVGTATTAFCYVFERPGKPRLEIRIEKAKEYYEIYKNKEKPNGYFGIQGVTNDGDNIYNQGHYTDSLGHTFTLYRQSNYKQSYWNGTIASHGCGPSSCAIILSGLKDPSISPETVASGKKWRGAIAPMVTYLKSYGLEASSGSTNNNEIIKKLKKGYKLIVNVHAGNIGDYYYKGHYYTIVDIDENNNVFVIDPGPTTFSKGNNKGGGNHGWYSLDKLTGKAAVIYIK